MSFKSALLVAAVLAGQVSCAIIKIIAQADYEKQDPFEFIPNQVTARVGDVLEFHFAGTGNGVLGGNHSVAQGIFGNPCTPQQNGFWSGFMGVNATSFEADNVFQVPVMSTQPMVFYCAQGQHCARGMHGVVNGAGQQTLENYRRSISSYIVATVPTRIGGGEMVPNNISNIVSTRTGTPAAANSVKVPLASIITALGLALVMA